MKNIAIVAFLCLITTACTKKIHAEDIGFHNDTVYYEGQPFTGEIWTSDNTTGCIVTEKGIMKSLTFYHSKGKHAIVMTEGCLKVNATMNMGTLLISSRLRDAIRSSGLRYQEWEENSSKHVKENKTQDNRKQYRSTDKRRHK